MTVQATAMNVWACYFYSQIQKETLKQHSICFLKHFFFVTSFSKPERKARRWVCVRLFRRLLGVVVLYELLHVFHTALSNVPEVLLQRVLDWLFQGRILRYQHLRHKAEHFTFLIVHLQNTHVVQSETDWEGNAKELDKWVRIWVMRFPLPLNGQSVEMFTHKLPTRIVCVPEYRFLWTFFCSSSYLLPECLSCDASISLQPWKYEKQKAIVSVKWVETHTHTFAQSTSTASCDVCHIEVGIEARVGASCDRGQPG